MLTYLSDANIAKFPKVTSRPYCFRYTTGWQQNITGSKQLVIQKKSSLISNLNGHSG